MIENTNKYILKVVKLSVKHKEVVGAFKTFLSLNLYLLFKLQSMHFKNKKSFKNTLK